MTPQIPVTIAYIYDEDGDTHTSGLFAKPCKVFVRGALTIYIKILAGKRDEPGWDGLPMIEHERKHAEIAKKHWENLVRDVDWVDDTNGGYKAGTNRKATQIINFVNAARKYHTMEESVENALFDVNAYGKDRPDTELGKEANADYAKYQNLLIDAKAEYERTRREIGT